MINLHLLQIEFQGGLVLTLKPNEILVIVGPNNSGKSLALSEISRAATLHSTPNSILKNITTASTTSFDDMQSFLASFRLPNGQYQIDNHTFQLNQTDGPSGKSMAPLQNMLHFAISYITTTSRLSDCNPPSSLDMSGKIILAHPFHRMYCDDGLEAKVSAACRRAFGKDIAILRAAGNVVPAVLGDIPLPETGEDRISKSYLTKLHAVPRVDRQGDGVKSFVSVVSRIIAENRPILIIDEPEAFLHPPQARLVGEVIASEDKRQVFVATHSSDVLQGLLNTPSDRVSVVRLIRQSDKTQATYLDPEKVSQLWRDPILRFSNILDGLFHDAVIVTEADADCRFYEAIVNASLGEEGRLDIHYTYSGGKDRIPVVVASLLGLHVPVVTIVDADILNDEQPLRRIVEAHCGDWSEVESDRIAVKQAVEQKDCFLGGDRFREAVSRTLDTYGKGVSVPKEVLSKIKKLVRNASPWDSIKESGLCAISKGEPTIRANRLLETLRNFGIFVVRIGEMEGFCRSIGGHGPRWVEEVMKRNLRDDPEMEAGRKFATAILAYLQVKACD